MNSSDNVYKTEPQYAFTAIAGKFPGSPDVESFWEKILKAQTAGLTELSDRWGLIKESYYHPNPGTPYKIYADRAFCLPEKQDDKGRQIHFGINVLKRLKDELTDGGSPPDFSSTALVAGTSWSDQGYYLNDIELMFNGKDNFKETFSPEEQLKALADSIEIGGPKIAVDTACASSLYAVEAATQLIKSGQANTAVIIGLSTIIPPFLMSGFSQLMALSPEGECLPFSKDANGMVPGEAAAAVFLEPIEDALLSGRDILGVLCSSGLSSDGSEGFVFAPGTNGQQAAFERAYKNINPSDIDYIEGHGTATALGDKTELESLNTFFSPYFENSSDGRKLYIGSVKSIIGHSLAAAGICSLIKSLLMLKNKIIPPHINVAPSPVLNNRCTVLAKNCIPLDTSKRPARIGISSFGFGGSNIHMVLESYDIKKHIYIKNAENNAHLFPDLAIIDFEAGYGKKSSASELYPDFYKNFNKEKFPESRFGIQFAKSTDGYFLPGQITLDAKGLRSGPKFLSRVDAFQNYTVNLANNIIKRHPDIKNSNDTAVSMSFNIGGAKSIKMSRKYYARFYLDPETVDHDKITDTTLEDIASSLGAMASGYPALHFNLKAFHQTFSGDTSTFWRTLLMAPYMLKRHCSTLFAGAANFIKSPIDFYTKQQNGALNVPVLEGAALFLLKNALKAKKDQNKILATINAVIPSYIAGSYEDACRIVNIKPENIDIREFSQLEPESDYKQENCHRFVGEATGTDLLASILLTKGKNASIEIYTGKALTYTIFLEKHENRIFDKPKIELPVSLQVNDGTGYLKKKKIIPLNPNQTDLDMHSGDYSPKGIHSMSVFESWFNSTASAVEQFLKTQKNLAQMMASQHPPCPAIAFIENNDPDSVLKHIAEIQVRTKPEDNKAHFHAELIVDEDHPYFFDHPLDHVPGILILQGGIELFNIAINHSFKNDMFISELSIDFKKICEKTIPIEINCSIDKPNTHKTAKCTCEVLQKSQVVATLSFTAKKTDETLIPPANKENFLPKPFPDKAVLHKHKAENVLVSDYTLKGEAYYFDILPPPDKHILGNHGKKHHSMLYILEITRQCGMVLVHQVLNVPLKIPMILLGLKFNFERPAYCSQRLKISHKATNKDVADPTVKGEIDFFIHDSVGIFGSSHISTLMAKF